MSEPFLSEIKIVSFNFPPKGWAQCNGQILPINQNQALFALLGTTYGGNGTTTFALPGLQGRTPIHANGSNYAAGQVGGETTHTLTNNEVPSHTHVVNGTATAATTNVAVGNVLGSVEAATPIYGQATNLTALDPNTMTTVGDNQPHQNMQPFLTLNFCIALQGIF